VRDFDPAHDRLGSSASDRHARRRGAMSVSPPIATNFMYRSEMSRGARLGHWQIICKIWYLISRTVSEDDASRQQCKIWYLISPRFALAGFFFPSVLGVGSVSALFLAGSGKVGPVRSTQRSAIVHVPAAFT
jgi:hypothetical protein